MLQLASAAARAAGVPHHSRNYLDVMKDASDIERVDSSDGHCVLPAFYVIGAMKAATTQLSNVLGHLPGVLSMIVCARYVSLMWLGVPTHVVVCRGVADALTREMGCLRSWRVVKRSMRWRGCSNCCESNEH